MKKMKVLILALVVALVFAGCGSKKEDPEIDVETMDPPSSAEDLIPEEEVKEEIEEDVKAVEEELDALNNDNYKEAILSQTEGLVQNEYPELEVTAAILERKAILPGHPINVHVTLNNTGDKTVRYIKGSGTAVVPSALYVYADGMQTVFPKEHYGPMTMDLQTLELAPGESVEYVYTLLAVEPYSDFDALAMELLQDGVYVGETPVEELGEKGDVLTPVSSGSYKANVVFVYSVEEEGAEQNSMGDPTGYATAEFDFSVN